MNRPSASGYRTVPYNGLKMLVPPELEIGETLTEARCAVEELGGILARFSKLRLYAPMHRPPRYFADCAKVTLKIPIPVIHLAAVRRSGAVKVRGKSPGLRATKHSRTE